MSSETSRNDGAGGNAPAPDSREALRAERDKLLARLAEINAKLGN